MAGLILVWLACMVGYHHYLQREYIRAWHLQKNFWRQVMDLAPDAGLGWTVIVDGTPAQSGPVMWSNSWADYYVYRLIFTTGFDLRGPAFAHTRFDPKGPIFAHLGYLGGLSQFRIVNDQVEWRPLFWGGPHWGGPFVPIDPARLVLLADDRGVLRRVPEISTTVAKLVSAAAPPAAQRTEWPSTPVSRLLFADRSP